MRAAGHLRTLTTKPLFDSLVVTLTGSARRANSLYGPHAFPAYQTPASRAVYGPVLGLSATCLSHVDHSGPVTAHPTMVVAKCANFGAPVNESDFQNVLLSSRGIALA